MSLSPQCCGSHPLHLRAFGGDSTARARAAVIVAVAAVTSVVVCVYRCMLHTQIHRHTQTHRHKYTQTPLLSFPRLPLFPASAASSHSGSACDRRHQPCRHRRGGRGGQRGCAAASRDGQGRRTDQPSQTAQPLRRRVRHARMCVCVSE